MTTPTTFWRIAGMSYVQYVNRATTALRSALKEPAKTKAAASETFSFNVATWEAGEMGAKKALGKAP
eukprot:CAMPEP_0178939222 /NCGR_PEP_ID=MMETSP0789-20121207/87_1 /TAXON_ID=3005 /ORGANISM="Rhizosolenia setigera, Strain CCMP 1694" /LENGTH=66 /DNA_ID=CAMNT_0020618033 /DNA_START=220 /DNA_END=420 /DNA_ORIENTATION=+